MNNTSKSQRKKTKNNVGPAPRQRYPIPEKARLETNSSGLSPPVPTLIRPTAVWSESSRKVSGSRKVQLMDSTEEAVSNELSSTMQNLLEQMNLVTQTLGMFEERLSHNELILTRIDQRLAGVEAKRQRTPTKGETLLPPVDITEPVSTIPHGPLLVPVSLPSVVRLLQGTEEGETDQ